MSRNLSMSPALMAYLNEVSVREPEVMKKLREGTSEAIEGTGNRND